MADVSEGKLAPAVSLGKDNPSKNISPQSGRRDTPRGLFGFPGLGHLLVVIIVTTIEIEGLVRWLILQRGGNLASVAGPLSNIPLLQTLFSRLGAMGFAGALLLIFLLVEHVLSQMDQTGRFISSREFAEIITFSIIEVVVGSMALPHSQLRNSCFRVLPSSPVCRAPDI